MPIVGNSPDVPERAGTRPVGVKKKERPCLAGGHFKVESIDVSSVDGFDVDGQRDIAETQAGHFGDERRRDFGRFAEVQHRAIALVDQPFETLGRRCTAAGQLEVDGNEPVDSRAAPSAGDAAAAPGLERKSGQGRRPPAPGVSRLTAAFLSVCRPACRYEPAAGGAGGVAADLVTSPGKSSGGR